MKSWKIGVFILILEGKRKCVCGCVGMFLCLCLFCVCVWYGGGNEKEVYKEKWLRDGGVIGCWG